MNTKWKILETGIKQYRAYITTIQNYKTMKVYENK